MYSFIYHFITSKKLSVVPVSHRYSKVDTGINFILVLRLAGIFKHFVQKLSKTIEELCATS